MLLLRGFDYESVQTVYDFGGVLGYEIQVDPSQSWRFACCHVCSCWLATLCFEHGYPLFYRKNRRRSIWLKGLFSLYLLSGLMATFLYWFFLLLLLQLGLLPPCLVSLVPLPVCALSLEVPIFTIWANVILPWFWSISSLALCRGSV